MGSYLDDPNREAVGLEPAWAEGYGGEPGAGPAAADETAADETAAGETQEYTAVLDGMTKDELLAHAKEVGATPANAGMSKDELRESIEAARG